MTRKYISNLNLDWSVFQIDKSPPPEMARVLLIDVSPELYNNVSCLGSWMMTVVLQVQSDSMVLSLPWKTTMYTMLDAAIATIR